MNLVHSLFNDPAYLAIVDVARYEKDFPDWDYDSLSQKLVGAMNRGEVVAWGTPESDLRIRLTTEPCTAKADAITRGRLATDGVLCLASYTSLTMCAQFEDERFPQRGDLLFEIPKGAYDVTVHRLFAHEDGAQFAHDDAGQLAELPKGDHYVVVFTPADETQPLEVKRIVWR